jgi:hypothetical protein
MFSRGRDRGANSQTAIVAISAALSARFCTPGRARISAANRCRGAEWGLRDEAVLEVDMARRVEQSQDGLL